MDATSYSLVAVLTDEWSNSEDPQHVVDKEKTAETLEKYISMSKEEILAKLNQKDLNQVEFSEEGKNLSYDTKRGLKKKIYQVLFLKKRLQDYTPMGYLLHI
ncbi:hypothetical protein LHA31_02985 [Carnobacterium viridans]|uniref:hypothetical protein n=1 Tax=Carnobacterium viridans TaxID=174587 RepID=UPI001CFF5CE3|nr:hypothetical protein [Carnobacterium viridans]UDE95755.1 hypothetical protein LHA31_02985 [Carnobacterium viridans]